MNTIEYYNKNAKEYFDTTINGDMKKAYDLFLKDLEKGSLILDFGCGSGRDSKFFIENGYLVDAIDGSSELCKLASEYINQEVKCMDFNDLNVINKYDAVWACSSIIHVKKENLKDILIKIANSIKNGGVFYTCFKNGSGEEINNGRYFNYLTYDEFISLINEINLFDVIHFYQTNSSTNLDEEKLWNNFIMVKK